MKKGLTELVFILDRSGSMSGLEADTIGGYNAMLAKQKAVKGACRITTVLFDNNDTLLHDRIELKAVSPLTERDYFVGGSTALLDAMGKTIEKIAAVQKSTAASYRAERVLFIIITDGDENASHLYDAERVKTLVEQQKKRYGWEFIFLGANIDAVEAAQHVGIAADRAVDYLADSEGTSLNFSAMSAAVCAFREGDEIQEEQFEIIRADLKRRKR